MSSATSPGLRCPQCSAHVSAAAQWCTLCYADLRPPVEEPEPAAPLVVDADGHLGDLDEPGDDGDVALTEFDLSAPVAAARPAPSGKHARAGATPTDVARDEEMIAARADEMIALLAQETRRDQHPLARAGSSAPKAMLAVGGSVVILAVLVLVMFVIGKLL